MSSGPQRATDEQLRDFVRESNRIEGIVREPTKAEVTTHSMFLKARSLNVGLLESFVASVARAKLRDKPGMNVRVGNHFPEQGSAKLRDHLGMLCEAINDGVTGTPYETHLRYEQLHPFMDGNGRSGRAIWAWQMQRDGLDPFSVPFLHRFYYQALDASR